MNQWRPRPIAPEERPHLPPGAAGMGSLRREVPETKTCEARNGGLVLVFGPDPMGPCRLGICAGLRLSCENTPFAARVSTSDGFFSIPEGTQRRIVASEAVDIAGVLEAMQERREQDVFSSPGEAAEFVRPFLYRTERRPPNV